MEKVQLAGGELFARERVCLALDVPSVEQALVLNRELSDLVGMVKVGKELHTAAGNEGIAIVERVYRDGGSVFLDLKLHDTPQTVYGAASACSTYGVKMFNVHVAGGEAMCKKALDGARDGAARTGITAVPKVIGVTVLTSLSDEDLAKQNLGVSYDDLVMRRTELAREWGLDGIVCPANKAGELEKRFGEWLYVTPGIKFAGVQNEGQKQLDTPEGAVQACKSSVLVIGSAITKAEDKRAAAYAILQSMAPHVRYI